MRVSFKFTQRDTENWKVVRYVCIMYTWTDITVFDIITIDMVNNSVSGMGNSSWSVDNREEQIRVH